MQKNFNKYMKALQLILIFAIIGFCLTDDTEMDECESRFKVSLQTKCGSIGSCTYNIEGTDNVCVATQDCSKGNGKTQAECEEIVPSNYHEYKCILEGSVCKPTKKECEEYNKIRSVTSGSSPTYTSITGDGCTKLVPRTGKGDECIIVSGQCIPHFVQCSSITSPSPNPGQCNNNIPGEPTKRCEWKKEGEETTESCHTYVRYCDYTASDVKNYASKDICFGLEIDTSDSERTKKKCIYSGSTCTSVYDKCDDYIVPGDPTDDSRCNGRHPVDSTLKDYDYSLTCKFDTSDSKCKPEQTKCNDYTIIPSTLRDEDMCKKLKPTDSNKVCVYAYDESTSANICEEVYNSCQLYNDNEIEKTRLDCQGIVLTDPNKECVYIPEQDKCEERQIYESCDSYPGKDKKICESIISKTTNNYCILDKDSKCKERPVLCAEAFNNKLECIYYAKASDTNKRCAYDEETTPTHTPKCYEEYARCEDYLENDSYICEAIRLYNGNKCEFIQGRCRSKNKICSEAKTEAECKLIAKTGVTDPDKKICEYTGSSCREQFKYCSDYREVCAQPASGTTTCETNCRAIKPYDESGESLDIYSRCEYEYGVGCQRVPQVCSEADGNPILCAEISPKIKDNSVKYCAYINDKCEEKFKKCEHYHTSGTYDSDERDFCQAIVPENNLQSLCSYKSVDGEYKCVTKTQCSLFSPADYETLCLEINPNCTYLTTYNSYGTCKKVEKSCLNTKFYKVSDDNEAICKSMEASVPYKICSLKEDKSGCEEVYRESIYPISSSAQQENASSSSAFIVKKVHLILILFCLLF